MWETVTSPSGTKPFLRWAGSKRQLLPVLSSFWNSSFERYVEPFMGSASLFFALGPRGAVLSDVNSELIQVFEAVKNHPDDLAAHLSELQIGSETFYNLRSTDPSLLNSIDRAVRFIYLNRYCFNGLFRTNQLGQFNVPYGGGKTGELPGLAALRNASLTLQQAELLCGDFESVLTTHIRPGDFVYLDPPFAVKNRRIFRQYGPATFGMADISRLGSVLREIHNRGAHFLLSYAKSPESDEVLGPWFRSEVTVQRNISGFSRHRRKDTEVLITNISRASGRLDNSPIGTRQLSHQSPT
jgi:DNA adenine methylase